VMPAILQKIQGAIWYITIGAIIAAILIAVLPWVLAKKSGKSTKKKAPATVQPAPEDSTI
ncbi:MAG: hypothetical protein ACTSV7_12645, partial [Candidatus Baldrarchaeia archaeon]